ncbi:MAG: type II toxin-antitoxin system HicA family toxin [Defluviitaleaceae bacterium]|nr:type II toxin-antitoxin system HicA family toxin [Defluviitaleaceae bacterium]MCL2239014.1 type II toxin-antitoxin system HicA family toxin [Defluviitaleaceae bacterium]
MADYTKQVLRLLSDNGCYFLRRGKGSHKMWYSPITNRPFAVVDKIENRHTANGILKDAGIKKKV